MDSDQTMRKKFLTLYDYGTGGCWMYICADSAQDVLDKYPELRILDREPDWFDDESRRITETVDIDDPTNLYLRGMRKPVPTVRLEMHVRTRDAVELRQLITKFAEAEGFALENVGPYPMRVQGYRNPMFTMLLVRSDMDILVENRRREDRYRVEICNAEESPEFEAVADKFQGLLESRWPRRVRRHTED